MHQELYYILNNAIAHLVLTNPKNRALSLSFERERERERDHILEVIS